MIRPITVLAFLAACGSGLYLYQEKHRVQLLDQHIEQTVHQTEKLREQTRMLHAEWTLLSDPDRLQKLASEFLSLKTVSPGQFTSMADLDSRLPPVPPLTNPAGTIDIPVAQDGTPEPIALAQEKRAVGADQDKPPATPVRTAQYKPVARPVHVAQDKAVEPARPVRTAAASRPAEPHRPRHVVAQAPSGHPRVSQTGYEPHARDSRRREPRPQRRWHEVEARTVPHRVVATAQTPDYPRPAPSQPATGSLLGMAHSAARIPAPLPLVIRPALASEFPITNGGG